jgi:hypothetical protein
MDEIDTDEVDEKLIQFCSSYEQCHGHDHGGGGDPLLVDEERRSQCHFFS